MTEAQRARAAKAFLANPLMQELLMEMRRGHLDAIAATALPDATKREYHYVATQVIAEMPGQLEIWARQAEPKK